VLGVGHEQLGEAGVPMRGLEAGSAHGFAQVGDDFRVGQAELGQTGGFVEVEGRSGVETLDVLVLVGAKKNGSGA
jgi:hypothetical protein